MVAYLTHPHEQCQPPAPTCTQKTNHPSPAMPAEGKHRMHLWCPKLARVENNSKAYMHPMLHRWGLGGITEINTV